MHAVLYLDPVQMKLNPLAHVSRSPSDSPHAFQTIANLAHRSQLRHTAFPTS